MDHVCTPSKKKLCTRVTFNPHASAPNGHVAHPACRTHSTLHALAEQMRYVVAVTAVVAGRMPPRLHV